MSDGKYIFTSESITEGHLIKWPTVFRSCDASLKKTSSAVWLETSCHRHGSPCGEILRSEDRITLMSREKMKNRIRKRV